MRSYLNTVNGVQLLVKREMEMARAVMSNQGDGEDEEGIAGSLAQGDGEEGEPGIGAHKAQGDSDDTAQDGEETEDANPRAVAFHPAGGAVNLLALYMQVTLYPFHLAQRAHTVVEHASCHVSHGGCDEELHGFEACQLQSRQHGFTAERKDAACNERGDEHSPITPGFEQFKHGSGWFQVSSFRNRKAGRE